MKVPLVVKNLDKGIQGYLKNGVQTPTYPEDFEAHLLEKANGGSYGWLFWVDKENF